MANLSSSSNQAGSSPEAPAQCRYAVNGHCRVWGLASCLQIMSSEGVHPEQRFRHAELLREALTVGPRFVSLSHVCCGNNTLLSLAVGLWCPVETLEFLLSHARFRQEDGCRITDFVEHLGSVMISLMANSRTYCFKNRLPGDGKKCLRLLLRVGSQNSFVKECWYDNCLIRTWLLSIFDAASTKRFAYFMSEAQEHPQKKYLIPIPALLDFAECIIEIFYDKDSPHSILDSSFWTAILKSLWTHAHITRGTLTRVADVTLRLLELGASKQIELTGAAKGGSFLACVESGLYPDDVMDPDLDDVDAMIGGQMIRGTNESGQNFVFNTDMLWATRRANIERLKTHVLGDGDSSIAGLEAAIDADLEDIQAENTASAGHNGTSAASSNDPKAAGQGSADTSAYTQHDWDFLDDIEPR
ncbi:hypothetical protein CI238_10413 [Colletotrichum incanum]|uniref:Uncharacterized protein n=1 Tax=Colletotrichum incanum TaxID=1573173 RepID=A0A161X0W8_COLIC|nr:hypothetical protein CI238_10413 [Colletotrichum incanum]OHW96066.1 hypothetical protein CSPAE12_05216 [Colletotrichum incanum]